MTEDMQAEKRKRGRPAKGDQPMTNAQRQAQHRARAKRRAEALPVAVEIDDIVLANRCYNNLGTFLSNLNAQILGLERMVKTIPNFVEDHNGVKASFHDRMRFVHQTSDLLRSTYDDLKTVLHIPKP